MITRVYADITTTTTTTSMTTIEVILLGRV